MKKTTLFLSLIVFITLLSACVSPQPVLQDVSVETAQPSPIEPTSVFEITPAFTSTATPPEATATLAPSPTSVPQPSPTSPPAIPTDTALTILSIDMLDLNQGWGEAMLSGSSTWALVHTEDGGVTWTAANLPGGYPAYSEYFVLDGHTLWAAQAQLDPATVSEAGAVVYRSDDSGQTWHASQPLSLMTSLDALAEVFVPDSLYFVDSNTGYLVASIGHYMNQDVVMIYQTLDGGQTWERVTDKFQAGGGEGAALPCDVQGVVFVDASHGWLAGNCLAVSLDERWKVLETVDGGRTWNYRDLPAPANAPADVLGEQAACGTDAVQRHPGGLITLRFRCVDYSAPGSTPVFNFTYTSIDNGTTWKSAELTSLMYAGSTFGIGLGPQSQSGDRSLYVSRDGGSTWSAAFPVTWPEATLDFVDPSNGWAVAWRYDNISGQTEYALVRTRDGGNRWDLVQAKAR